MAIACLRLVTFLPELPLRSVPALRSRITFSTFFWLPLLYFRAMCKSPLMRCVQPSSITHDFKIGNLPIRMSEDSQCEAARNRSAEFVTARQAFRLDSLGLENFLGRL